MFSSHFLDADDCITLVGLPLLFKEKPEKLVSFTEENNAIQISVKDKILTMNEEAFGVKVDGCTIFECDNFFQAFCGCIASIYVFNLAYPKELTKYFTFVQNILIGLKDGEGKINLDKRILNVLAALNTEMN